MSSVGANDLERRLSGKNEKKKKAARHGTAGIGYDEDAGMNATTTLAVDLLKDLRKCSFWCFGIGSHISTDFNVLDLSDDCLFRSFAEN